MAKISRIASTITSHEIKNDSLINSFYLDGRSNRFPQTNDIDITLDRSALGFYLTISSTRKADATRESILEKRRSQDEICEVLKDSAAAEIDSILNDMAENAIKIAGKYSLDTVHREARPYFSGLIVKSGELAAVTLGEASAFLYRNDALYPLTETEVKFDAVDSNGNQIANHDLYSAGRAGSIRYSNIAQLRVDDCIILTTDNVLNYLGQENLLKIFEETYDQQEAAEFVYEFMTTNYPDEPYQFMMSFVEDVFDVGKRYRGENFTSRDTQSTQVFSDDFNSLLNAGLAGASAGAVTNSDSIVGHDVDRDNREEEVDPNADHAEKDIHPAEQVTDEVVDDEDDLESTAVYKRPSQSEIEMEAREDEELAAELEEDLEDEIQETNIEDEDLDLDVEEIADEEESDKRRTIIVIAAIILLALALLFLAWFIRNNSDESSDGTSEQTTSEQIEQTTEATTVESTTEATTVEATTEVTTTVEEDLTSPTRTGANGGTYDFEYEIQWGDSFNNIVNTVYGESYNVEAATDAQMTELFTLIIENNPETIEGSWEEGNVMIFAESIIEMPDPSDILEVR